MLIEKKIPEKVLRQLHILMLILDKNDYIKWYRRYRKSLLFDGGKLVSIYKSQSSICDFCMIKNGIPFTYQLNEVKDLQNILDWVSENRKANFGEKQVKLFGKKYYLSLKQVIDLLEEALLEKKIDKEIKFEIFYESYNEDIAFSNGVIEIRGFQYTVIDVIYKNAKIGTLVYSELPQINDLIFQVNKKIWEYKNWIKYGIYKFEKKDSKQLKCIVEPQPAGQLFHESIGHLSELDIYQGVKEKDIKVGTKVSNIELHIMDYPYIKGIKTCSIFDEELTPAKPILLVKDGIYNAVMSDKENLTDKEAYKLCGSVKSSIDNSIPQIRMRNLIVRNGHCNVKQNINDMKFGLHIVETDDGKRESDTIFLHIKRAYIIKNGKYAGRIEDVWMQNKNSEFLQSISTIFNNGDWSEIVKCIKNGGSNYISTYSPGIVCKLNL